MSNLQARGEIHSPHKHDNSKKMTMEEREKTLVHNASLVKFPVTAGQKTFVLSGLSCKLVLGTRYVPRDVLENLFIENSISMN